MVRRVTLAFLGDLMLGRGVSQQLHRRAPEWFWGDVLPVLHQADAVFANLEGPISTAQLRQSWKMFHFRAAPTAVRILQCANVRFVCLANNHMLDYGERGLVDTMQTLDGADIHHAGAGRCAAEAAAPTILDVSGLKIGVIAATDNMRPFAARSDRPGTNFIEIGDSPANREWIDRSVNGLKEAGVGLIVLSLHWGPNMRTSPSSRFRRFAHVAIERGIDVIHGHSAHVVQAVERHQSGIILYDLGNFIDDYWKFPFRKTTWTFVFLMDIEDGRPTRLRLVPVETHSAPLGLATGNTSKAIKKRMISLCAAFGTSMIDTPQALEVPLGQAIAP